jgi:hypothetical protein
VSIDSTPPKIIKAYSDKATSPYDGYYTIGEVISIYLEFDKEILVAGKSIAVADIDCKRQSVLKMVQIHY